MFAEQYLRLAAFEAIADVVANPQLLAQPQRHRHQVRAPAARRGRGVGLDQSLEFHERLFIEADEVHLRTGNAGLTQAILNGVRRKPGVVLLARETLLLRCRDDAPVFDETGGGVVVVRGDAEDPGRRQLEQGVDERRDRARL